MPNCENTVEHYTPRGTKMIHPCGYWFAGEKLYCDDCEMKLRAIYPQGWSYYAGDRCPHGVYVGGSGIDWMCGACESEQGSEYMIGTDEEGYVYEPSK